MYNISTLIAINFTYLSILFTPSYFFSNWSSFHIFAFSSTAVIYLFQTKWGAGTLKFVGDHEQSALRMKHCLKVSN